TQTSLLERVGIAVESPTPAAAPLAVPIARGSSPLDVLAPAADVLVAVIPSWRRDLAIEADIVEELARVHGYDLIPATLPATAMPTYRRSPLALRDAVRTALAGHGLREVVAHALVDEAQVERWAWVDPGEPAHGEEAATGEPITVTNPLSMDHAVLRQGLVGGLLGTIASNRRRGQDDLALFEVGKGYGRVGDVAHEWWRLGIALAGAFDVPAWNRPRRLADLDDIKGIIEELCGLLRLSAPTYTAVRTEPTLHAGRAARVSVMNDQGRLAISGLLGEIHPGTAAADDERMVGVLIAELSIAGLSSGALPAPRGVMPGRFPVVERDIAIVMSESVPAGDVDRIIWRSGGDLLHGVRLFDIYRGQPLASGERSLAYRLLFEAERTLSDDEIESAVAAVQGAVVAAGGRIRS
ncbi:MAG: hypothetical protein ABI555_06210, partial [Chloroflexota bacterium]